MLKYDATECAFVCTDCGAIYSKEEIHRAFSYGHVIQKDYLPIYCMDCGVEMTECDLTDYEDD